MVGWPENLALRPSRCLANLLLASHAAFLGGVFFLSWPIALRLALAVVLLASLRYQLKAHDGATAMNSLRLGQGGGLECGFENGRWVPAKVLARTTVLPWLVVLRLELAGQGRRSAVVLPDSLPAQDFRRLRVWLRWCNGGR